MHEEIGESISVLALFRAGQAFPKTFDWRGREYKIDKINLFHQEKRGETTLFCFSVSAGGNSYELSFDNQHLTWNLDRIWTE